MSAGAAIEIAAVVDTSEVMDGQDGLVGEWVDAWDSHDGARLAGLYTSDGLYEDVPTGLTATGPGIAGFADYFTSTYTSGLRWQLRSATRLGDWATAEWTFSAENASMVPGEGAAGKSFEVRGSTVFQLSDGKIRRSSDYYDRASILRQVGVLHEPQTS